MSLITIIPLPLYALIILIALSIPTAIFILGLFIYFIAGIHDLIVSDKVAKGKHKKKKKEEYNCPYLIEKD